MKKLLFLLLSFISIISYGQNVGIGTTNPQSKLHINGDAKIDSGYTLELGAGLTKETNAGKIGYQVFSSGLDIVGAGVDVNNRRINFYNEAGARFNGNVAIATAGLLANKLSVGGGTVIGQTYAANNIAPANGLLVQGNVGIGTTNPLSKLQVVGKIAADSLHLGGTNINAQLHTTGNVIHRNLASTNMASIVYVDSAGMLSLNPAPPFITLGEQNVNQSIQDGSCTNGVVSTINVSGMPNSINASSLYINLGITHYAVVDLFIYLRAPNGKIIVLLYNNGQTGDFISCKLTDNTTRLLPPNNSNGNIEGIYKPAGTLSAISCNNVTPTSATFSALADNNGIINPNGTWTITVIDQYQGDLGTFNNWNLGFENTNNSINKNFIPKWNYGKLTDTSSIYDNGNVGIGTISPLSKLHIIGTTRTDTLNVINNTTSKNLTIDSNANFQNQVNVRGNNSQLKIYETDNANKQWKYEVNNGNMMITEDGVATPFVLKPGTNNNVIVTSNDTVFVTKLTVANTINSNNVTTNAISTNTAANLNGINSQLKIIETDNANKQWKCEVNNSNMMITEDGIATPFVLKAGTDNNVIVTTNDTVAIKKLQVGNNGTALAKMQNGTYSVGPGGVNANTKQVTLTFPTAFTSIPRVVATVQNELSTYNDEFMVTIKSISTTNVVFIVRRLDAVNAGWGQSPVINWWAFE
jgi:subtilisin-like proprotein convertase family protein